MELASLIGTSLGTRSVRYEEDDLILYALAIGARATDLDLVFERQLRVLPTFAMTLGLWAADAVGELGAFAPTAALHGAQRLEVHKPLPPSGQVDVAGRVDGVWDKGRSAVVDVTAASEYFTATYSIFLPGQGGWGGARGPAAPDSVEPAKDEVWAGRCVTSPEQAALYRLTGDRHLIHIDPGAARAAGLPGVVLHGLCTLGMAARELAVVAGAHPADLRSLCARFAAPVVPGDGVDLKGWATLPGAVEFRATSRDTAVLTGGHAVYQSRPSRLPE